MNKILLPKGYTRCSAHGCADRAVRVPVLCVPKTGREPTRENSIEAMMNIPCCVNHSPGVRDMWSEALKQQFIAKAAASPDKPGLDFDKAFVAYTSMLNPKYDQMMDRAAARRAATGKG